MKNLLHTGRRAMIAAAVWSVFDALLHVAIDSVEAARITGNIVVIVAAVVTQVLRPGRLSAFLSGLAAAATIGLNVAWFINGGEIPIPALILILVALALLAWAARRFLAVTPAAGVAVAPDLPVT